MPRPEDLDRLRHMVEAAREATGLTAGRSREDLDEERLLQLGLVRLVEIVGEAAGRVSPETQAMAPHLPWPMMVSMRNRLIHDYFTVDLDVVWDTVTLDLPELIPQLERLIDEVERALAS